MAKKNCKEETDLKVFKYDGKLKIIGTLDDVLRVFSAL
jgi:hypothetical protein